MLFASIPLDVLEAKLNKICSDIRSLTIDGMDRGQPVSASIGAAVGPDTPAELLKKADDMLHKAKKNRGTVEIWA